MELKKVFFDMSATSIGDVTSQYIILRDIDLDNMTPQDTIVLCDSQAGLDKWMTKGYPCIGVESRGRLYNVAYVTDSLDGVDDTYLNMAFCRFYGLPVEILETERIKVREMAINDVDELFELYKGGIDFVEPLYEYEEEVEFTRKYIESMYGFYGYGLWLLIRKSDGKIIGRAGLSNRMINDESHIELGYLIGKDYRKQGYAYEACQAILEYALNTLEMKRIIACIDEENIPSIAFAKKLGFKEFMVSEGKEGMRIFLFE